MNLLFDIGGTNMRLAASAGGQTLGQTKTVPTPQKYEDAIAELSAAAKELAGESAIDAIAGGVAGPFNHERSQLVNAPHLRDWINKPLQQRLKDTFKTEHVYLENDAALAALGEAVSGAGKGYKIVAYLGIGTGVGGARIADQKLDQSYMAQEPGHMLVSGHKTLESIISGTAIMERKNMLPTDISDEHFWREYEDYLLIGINNLVVTWSPNIVIIGGTVGQIPNISVDRLSLSLYKTVSIFPQLPKIAKGKLIDTAGLYGALTLLNQKKPA